MHTKETIEKTIRETIKTVTNADELDSYVSLVDRSIDIIPADFLYIFSILEEKLQLPTSDIFKDCTYEVMTISGLTDALSDLQWGM